MNFLVKVAAVITAIFLSIFGIMNVNQQSYGSAFAPTGGGTYRLLSSVGTSNTTVTLSSFKEPVSNIKYTMSYLNTDVIYGTLDPQTSKPEFISATGITQNSDGTATLTGVTRGLSRTPAGSNCTASTTLAQSHAAQSIFIISDSPCFFQEYTPLRTAATSSAVLVFSSTTPPRLDSPAAQSTGTYIATTSEFASISYVNAVAVAGASNGTESVKGLWEGATQIEMASSTVLGGTGAGLVLQSRYATSSPGSAGLWAVITQNSGKIAQGFIDLATTYTWTGLHTFSNGLTSNGTTTVLASSLTTNPFVINGLAYKFPSTRAASDTVLMENGSGSLAWQYPQGAKYTFATTTQITVVNGSATSTGITIPAGFFTASSTISVMGGGICLPDATGGNSCQYIIKAGNSTIATYSYSASNAGSASASFNSNTVFNNSISSQSTVGNIVNISSNGATFLGDTSDTIVTTSSVDFSQAVTLTVVAKSTGTHDTTYLRGFTIIVTR